MMAYPWLQTVWDNLKRSLLQKHLSHALLLSGPSGLGKQHLAIELAGLLLCTARTSEQEACGQCKSCHLFAAKTHPDFIFTQPIDSDTIKIDQVREMIHELNQTPQISQRQVVIITPGEALNKMAANALLKTLEEPPGEVQFIILSSAPSFMPSTVRSRCGLIRLARPDSVLVRQWLSDKVSPDKLDALIARSDGLPLKALSYLDSEADEDIDLYQDFAALSLEQLTPAQLVAKWQNISPTVILDSLISWVQSGIRLNLLSYQDEIPDLCMKKICQIHPKLLIKFIDRLYELKKHRYHQLNTNQSLQLEAVMTSWSVCLQRTR